MRRDCTYWIGAVLMAVPFIILALCVAGVITR
jgi:hypothetical protein